MKIYDLNGTHSIPTGTVEIVKPYSETIDGCGYVAFAGGCCVRGKEVYPTRAGKKHLTQSDTSTYGKLIYYIRSADGTWSMTEPTLTRTGYAGEIRDVHLTQSKVQNRWFLMTGTTVMSGQTALHYTRLYALDGELDEVDYTDPISSSDNTYFCSSNVVTTPTGHLLFMAWTSSSPYSIRLYRSNEAYTGTLSSLTWSYITIISPTTTAINETDLGYCNGKLYAVTRRENLGSLITYTTNLEGTDGWQTPTALTAQLYSPQLLQDCPYDMLLIACSLKGTNYRYPAIGLIDIANLSVYDIAPIDTDMTGTVNGYPTLVPLGGGTYGMMYYLDNDNDTYTEVRYQQVNIYKWLNTAYLSE